MHWRRSRPLTDASRARVAAARSLSTASAERDRQQGLADAEHREVITPLRRMREANHLAEMFRQSLERGDRDTGPAAG